MRAVVLQDAGTVAVGDVDEPGPLGPGDALVRVRRAAICGSDLHVVHGRIPGMLPGGVLGHEYTGVVEAVGAAVTGVAVGDRVLGAFCIPCGTCRPCRRRAYNHCPDLQVLGYGMFYGDLPGTQAERVRVPNADLALRRIPEGVDDEQVLLAGDILATAYYANRLGGVGEGTLVAVQGCGPVGLLTIQVARALGAQVVAVDLDEQRLARAAGYGAHTVNATRANPGVAMDAFGEGTGAEVVLDTAGGPASVLLQAFDLVRPGGTIAVVGVYSDLAVTIPLAQAFVANITLRLGGVCPVQAVWDDVLDMIARGEVTPEDIITHRMPLEDAAEGYALFESREALKVVLDVSGQSVAG
jgi:threonine dehydrogenase-like Zn-dependent dehydrogenase